MSAMFNLTEMVEDLLLASGKPRKPLSQGLGPLPARDRPGIPPSAHALSVQGSIAPAVRSTDFGTLGRRRGGLAILAAVLLAACLAWAALVGAGNAASFVPRVIQPAQGGLVA